MLVGNRSVPIIKSHTLTSAATTFSLSSSTKSMIFTCLGFSVVLIEALALRRRLVLLTGLAPSRSSSKEVTLAFLINSHVSISCVQLWLWAVYSQISLFCEPVRRLQGQNQRRCCFSEAYSMSKAEGEWSPTIENVVVVYPKIGAGSLKFSGCESSGSTNTLAQ